METGVRQGFGAGLAGRCAMTSKGTVTLRILHFHPGEWTDATRMLAQCTALKGDAGAITIGYGDDSRPPAAVWAEFLPSTIRRWNAPGVLRYVVRFLQEIVLGFKLARLARAHEVDCLHGHHAHCLIPCAVFGLLSHRALVYDTHDMPLHDECNQGYGGLVWAMRRFVIEPFVVRRARATLHVSQGIVEVYRRVYPSARHVLLRNLPPYSDHALLRNSRVTEERAEARLKLVYFGNIYPERLPIGLMDAIASDESVALSIYGDLPGWVSGIDEYWRRFHVIMDASQGRISYKGRYTPRDVEDIVSAYHFAILPYELTSQNVRYCMPNKFYQALSAGLGLIVSGPSEMSAVVSELGIGFWFRDGDVGSFHATLEQARAAVGRPGCREGVLRAGHVLIDRSLYRRTLLEAYGQECA